MECQHSDMKTYPPMGKNLKRDMNFGISNWQVSLRVIEDTVKRVRDSFYTSPEKKLQHITKIDLVKNRVIGSGQWLCKHEPHILDCKRSGEQAKPMKKFNLIGKKKRFNIACYVWARLILLEYGRRQVLNVSDDHGVQHLKEVTLAVQFTAVFLKLWSATPGGRDKPTSEGSLCSLIRAGRAARWRVLSNCTLVGRQLPKYI
ncbi:hypothetical protein TNCV_355261 [Trichonephila clavipes]|uniref:Uncharacterized protein n=1 Tax=Trichonephila clavipes TaxID=2585209 RepID=A0A8X6W0Y2_TRICX|nr:hypothetical protein TNCV_355261 [Trichonephila clavipes]